MYQYIEAMKGNSFVSSWLVLLGSFGIYLKIPSSIFYLFLRGYTNTSLKTHFKRLRNFKTKQIMYLNHVISSRVKDLLEVSEADPYIGYKKSREGFAII